MVTFNRAGDERVPNTYGNVPSRRSRKPKGSALCSLIVGIEANLRALTSRTSELVIKPPYKGWYDVSKVSGFPARFWDNYH